MPHKLRTSLAAKHSSIGILVICREKQNFDPGSIFELSKSFIKRNDISTAVKLHNLIQVSSCGLLKKLGNQLETRQKPPGL